MLAEAQTYWLGSPGSTGGVTATDDSNGLKIFLMSW
jgi:hypothetical protein